MQKINMNLVLLTAFIILTSITVGVFIGCGGGGGGGVLPTDGTATPYVNYTPTSVSTAYPSPMVTVNPNSVAITDTTDSQLNRIDGNTMYFNQGASQIGSLTTGSYIAGKSGNGYLKKVVSVTQSNGEWVVNTEQATLAEYFKQTNLLGTTGQLSTSDIVSEKGYSQVKLIQKDTGDWTVNFDKLDIISDGNGKLTLDGSLTMVKPNHDLAVQINNSSLAHAKASLTCGLKIEAKASATGEISGNKEWTLKEWTLKPIYIQAGIVPIVVVPIIKVKAKVEAKLGAGAYYSVNADGSYTAGAEYTNGGWQKISNFTKNATGDAVAKSICEGKISLIPEVEFMVYGVAGPTVDVDGYLKYKSEYPFGSNFSYKLYFGIESNVTFDTEVFDKKISDLSMNIYSNEWMIKEYPDSSSLTPTSIPSESTPTPTSIPSQATPTPVSESMRIVGVWDWFNGWVHEFRSDGTVITLSGSGNDYGTWTYNGNNQYTINWKVSGWVDHMTMSNNGTYLDGGYYNGQHFYGNKRATVLPTPVSTVTVSSRQITLHVYDNGSEDGDIVTIYMNGNTIVSSLSLTNAGNDYTVNLTPGSNVFAIYAHNEGSGGLPVNSCTVDFIDSSGSKKTVVCDQGTGATTTYTINAP